MTMLAADTWGIPGPAFAGMYFLLLLVVAVVVFVGRRFVGGGTVVAGPTLTPVEVAYLRGGDRLAVATALGQLRAAGVLDDQARVVGQQMGKDPLETALVTVLRSAGKRRSQRQLSSLTAAPKVRTVLKRLRETLRERGLIRTPGGAGRARAWSLLLWAVVVLGVARAVAGSQNGKPVGVLVFEIVVAVVVALVATLTSPGGQLPAARAAIADAKRQNAHLDPKLAPSWTTYGAAGAGMSIALFGAGALLLAEPAFADAVAAKQLMASGGSGDGGASFSGSSSSCGGGSSCSGGSSCGGGGGCGGGGCGG